MIGYETALKNYEKILEKYRVLGVKLKESEKELEKAKGELEIECSSCHQNTKANKIEFIIKEYNHRVSYLDNYNGDWSCSTKAFWVCPNCKELQNPPPNEGPFILGFSLYVKIIHIWNSDVEQCHGRVLELLTPHFEREEKRRKAEEKDRKIKEAKELLEKEGIL